MADSTVIDDDVVDGMLKDICNALMQADVNFKLVMELRKNIKNRIALEDMAAGLNRRKAIQKAVIDELCNLMDSGKEPKKPKRGRANVIMFVGLQGSGKTTTVAKLARHYKRGGWKTAMVCADTFRAGAFDQLKQNAIKVKVPYYGSYTDTDPVNVAAEGVARFKEEGMEIIIVDTSGRHKQEEALFTEMEEVAAAVKPQNVIFVMDASIGQAAFDQASAFSQRVDVGSVILTKMDGHAKGGGALSAVSATQSPVVFIGTGEHMDDLQQFSTKSFVSKLLGMGDIEGLFQKISKVVDKDAQPKMLERIQAGEFSLRDMYEQFQNILQMGPLNQVMEMVPGMSQLLNTSQMKGVDGSQKLKNFMTIMDSMTDDELDDDTLLLSAKKGRETRIIRIARGSGRSIREVNELLEQFKHFQKMMRKMKGIKVGKGGNISQRNMGQVAQMLPPGLMKQMGGMNAVQSMMRNMGGMEKMMGKGGRPGT